MAAASVTAIATRPQQPADRDFLSLLYRSFRWEELAPLAHWSDADKIAFLDQQFAAQYAHYAAHYPASEFLIIQADGAPIGRLAIDRTSPHEIRIVDIGLLPDWRGRGVGSGFLHRILDEAGKADKAVTIHVEQTNPALTLYRRLGFTAIEARGPYWLMEWRARVVQANTA